jgi:hypothetical protein
MPPSLQLQLQLLQTPWLPALPLLQHQHPWVLPVPVVWVRLQLVQMFPALVAALEGAWLVLAAVQVAWQVAWAVPAAAAAAWGLCLQVHPTSSQTHTSRVWPMLWAPTTFW